MEIGKQNVSGVSTHGVAKSAGAAAAVSTDETAGAVSVAQLGGDQITDKAQYAARLQSDIGEVSGSGPKEGSADAAAIDTQVEVKVKGQTHYVSVQASSNGPDDLYQVQLKAYPFMGEGVAGCLRAKIKGNVNVGIDKLAKEWFTQVLDAGEDQKSLARLPRYYDVSEKEARANPRGQDWQRDRKVFEGTFIPGAGDYLPQE